MSGFKVQPAALDGFAKTLGSDKSGLADECSSNAVQYTNEWVKLKGGVGGSGGLIYMAIVGKVNEVCSKLDETYPKIGNRISDSATALTNSASTYRDQEHSTAKHLDEVYKPGGITPLDDGVEIDKSSKDPSSELSEPSKEGAVPDLVQQILDGAGYFSESELVLKILSLCGLDVEQWVKDRFVGNFAEVAQSCNAIKNLSNFDDQVASTLAEDSDKMFNKWTGNAADGAKSYFDKLANAVGDHSGALDKVGQRYTALLVSVQQAASAIMNGITAAIDAAIEAAAAVGGAACVQEIPGVDILVDLIGAWRVWKVISAVHKVISTWNMVWSGHEGVMAIITGLVGGLSSYDADTKLPKSGYENAAQH